jgi:hypothetical protein
MPRSCRAGWAEVCAAQGHEAQARAAATLAGGDEGERVGAAMACRALSAFRRLGMDWHAAEATALLGRFGGAAADGGPA